MSNVSDRDLLQEYGRTKAEDAFEGLVHRHVDLVYSTAFRVLRNATFAEDVAQRVFLALAQHASKLQHRAVLTGWLYETARNFAVTLVRGEERRRLREKDAAAMSSLDSNDSAEEWDRVSLHLDEALEQLNKTDRDAIVLRYFGRKTAREIGKQLGLSEEAAQKRATRALEQLRLLLGTRGVQVPTTSLATLLSIQAVQSAPIGLAASVIGFAGTANSLVSSTSALNFIMVSTKMKLGLAAALLVGVATPLAIQHQTNLSLRNELSALRQENRQASERLAAAEVARYQGPTDGEQQRELLRLRGEVSSLRKQVSQFSNTSKELAKQRRQNARESDAPLVARETWKNVGLGTPIETFQTLSWARENRETNIIANSLSWADEQARSKIDAIFAAAPEAVRAKYGSADAYILSLFDHPVPDDSRRVVGYRILTENIAEDTASLLVEQEFGDGRKSAGLMRYVRIGDEWRQALDFDGPDTSKMSAGLQAEAGSNPEDTEIK